MPNQTPISSNVEEYRIRALHEYNILNTLPEKEYDNITKLAAFICDCPISLISLVGNEKQFFKSHFGIEISETPREHSICSFVIENTRDFIEIPNVTKDKRFLKSLKIIGGRDIVFFAGVPLINEDDYSLGTLCVIDIKERSLSPEQKDTLKILADQVVKLLELHKKSIELNNSKQELLKEKKRLLNIVDGTKLGTWEWNVSSGKIISNNRCAQILGYKSNYEIPGTLDDWRAIIHGDDINLFNEEIEKCLSNDINHYDIEYRIKHFKGHWTWIHEVGNIISRDEKGDPIELYGTRTDITNRKIEERQFQAMTDNIPGAVYRYKLNPDGTDKFITLSKGAQHLWGYTPKAILNDINIIWKNFFEEDIPLLKKSIKDSAENLTKWQAEWRTHHPDGGIRWHRGRGIPQRNEDGSTIWDSIILDVTEEKLANAKVYELNEKLEEALKIAKLGYWKLNVKSSELFWSDQIFEICGLEKETYQPSCNSFYKSIYERDRERYKRLWEESISTGKEIELEFRIVHQDGSIRWLHEKLRCIEDEFFNILFIEGTVQDITRQKELAISLEKSNQRFNYVVKATSNVIWDFDLIRNELYYGDNLENIFGHSAPAEGIGNLGFWENNLHPEDRTRILANFEHIINSPSETKWAKEYRFKRKDGVYVNVLDKGYIIRNDNGKATRMVGAMQDITQVILREQQLKWFKTVLNNTKDAIVITKAKPIKTSEGPEIVYVNNAFTKMMGYQENEILGKTPRLFHGPKTDVKTLELLRENLRAGIYSDVDIMNYTKQGKSYWANLSIAPVLDDKGVVTHMISIQKDITKRKVEELRISLINKVAHIFNQPLKLQEALKKTLENLVDFGDFGLAEVWLINADSTKINQTAFFTQDKNLQDFYKDDNVQLSYVIGQGLPGITWEQQKSQFWNNVDENESFVRQHTALSSGLKTTYSEPIFYNGKIIGVFIIGLKTKDIHKNNHINILSDFGSHFGAEIKKKQLDEELNQLFNFAPDIICEIDKFGNFKKTNDTLYKILGYSNEDLKHLKFWDIIHPDSLLDSKKEMLSLSLQSDSIYIENQCLSKSGKVVYMAWSFNRAAQSDFIYSVGKDISDKKKLQELLDKATDYAKVGSWEADLITNKIYWSSFLYKIFEVDDDFEPTINYLRNAIKDVEHLQVIREGIQKAKKENVPFDVEIQITTSKGNHRWIRVIGEPELINGEICYVRGSVQDIHARKHAEEERVNILESIEDGFFAVDKNWVVNYRNKKARILASSYKNSDILGANFWEFFDGFIGSKFYNQYHIAVDTKQVVNFEEYFDPSKSWLDVSAYPTNNGLSIYFRDITEKKNAIEEIKISNERFEKVSEATQDAIYDCNFVTGEIFWGKGFKTLFGYDHKDPGISIETWVGYVHPNDKEQVVDHSTKKLFEDNTNILENEYSFLKKDGSYAYVYDRAAVIRDDEGKPIRLVGALQDISERRNYEISLKRLNIDLERQTKELELSNAELEQFAYIASHDLQEPLRMISSFLTQIVNKYDHVLDEKGRKYIHFAVDGAKRMRHIILDLLEFSRVGNNSDSAELIDTEVVINEVILLLNKKIKESKATISFEDLPKINTYPVLLRQVFQNIIENALKYQPSGNNPIITITCIENRTNYEFTITDNGIGIDPEFYENIFIIFQRLHNRDKYSGTGMGLAITKKIIESLGGKIWVEPNYQGGCKFKFTLNKIEI